MLERSQVSAPSTQLLESRLALEVAEARVPGVSCLISLSPFEASAADCGCRSSAPLREPGDGCARPRALAAPKLDDPTISAALAYISVIVRYHTLIGVNALPLSGIATFASESRVGVDRSASSRVGKISWTICRNPVRPFVYTLKAADRPALKAAQVTS
jgi:hypothetical protein